MQVQFTEVQVEKAAAQVQGVDGDGKWNGQRSEDERGVLYIPKS